MKHRNTKFCLKESILDLAAGAMAIYCSRKDSDHPLLDYRLRLDLERDFPLRGTENGISAESVVRKAVGYRMYTDLPDRCSILFCSACKTLLSPA